MTEIQQPQQINRALPAPGRDGAIALIVVGILLIVGGWVMIAMAPEWSTIDSLLGDSNIVNTPSLVQKSAGGLLGVTVGGVFLAAGMVMLRLESWARWLRAENATSRD